MIFNNDNKNNKKNLKNNKKTKPSTTVLSLSPIGGNNMKQSNTTKKKTKL